MSGYFGTEEQRRLQMQAEANVAFINATPGACQTGRTMGCDDPDRFGWKRISEILERDGICGFRLLSTDQAGEVRTRLTGQDYRFDAWDVFIADRVAALAASEAIINRGLPDGLTELERPTNPDSSYVANIQALMGAAGIVPFSGSMLTGTLAPATTIAVGDRQGNVVAVAHGYLPHNSSSPYRRYAWGGLVAVAVSQRGKGLGNYVNARLVESVFDDIAATHIYELVSATNIPSRRMVTSCGLKFEPTLVCGVVSRNESARFTR